MVSMKALSLVLTSLISAQAFQPMLMKTSITNAKESSTTLRAVSRRCALLHGAAAAFLVAGSLPSFADITPLEPNNPIPDNEYVPAQRARSDKIDLNSAFVGDYKRLQGFFPHAAGMIASHGPYEKVSYSFLYKLWAIGVFASSRWSWRILSHSLRFPLLSPLPPRPFLHKSNNFAFRSRIFIRLKV
jgi:hypothetical protein